MEEPRAPVERFAIQRTLGRGGMATVHLAHDRVLDRSVALKILADRLADEPAFRDRFLREARLAAKLVHPNVVQVYDVGENERGPFIVMEYVDGETLADELRRRGRLPPAEVAEIGMQLCAGLGAAHAAGLVHRDVKPQNVLRRPDGRVEIADFGIARSLAAARETAHGTVLGTAAYLAPEQARGEPVTAAADVYSLGTVLYELLTGRPPFEAETPLELVLARELEAVTPPGDLVPDVPPVLESVVMRCLALRPEYRPSAAELARELAATIGAPAPAPAGRGGRRRRPVALVLGVAAVAALAGVAAAALEGAGFGSSAPRPTSGTVGRGTTTRSATPTTSLAATTHPASRPQAPPATAAQAIVQLRAAIVRAAAVGRLDPGAAGELERRLDDLARALQHPGPAAANAYADLRIRAQELQVAGPIVAALDRLAGFVPVAPVPVPRPPDHGPGRHRGHDHGDQG